MKSGNDGMISAAQSAWRIAAVAYRLMTVCAISVPTVRLHAMMPRTGREDMPLAADFSVVAPAGILGMPACERRRGTKQSGLRMGDELDRNCRHEILEPAFFHETFRNPDLARLSRMRRPRPPAITTPLAPCAQRQIARDAPEREAKAVYRRRGRLSLPDMPRPHISRSSSGVIARPSMLDSVS